MSTPAEPSTLESYLSWLGLVAGTSRAGGTVERGKVSPRSNALYALPLGVEQLPVASAVGVIGALMAGLVT